MKHLSLTALLGFTTDTATSAFVISGTGLRGTLDKLMSAFGQTQIRLLHGIGGMGDVLQVPQGNPKTRTVATSGHKQMPKDSLMLMARETRTGWMRMRTGCLVRGCREIRFL